MKEARPIPSRRGPVYFDATFLAFGEDLRGVPQVIAFFLRIFREHPEFAGVRILATQGRCLDRLAALGVPREWIVEVPALPFIGRFERFHGLASTWRYRRCVADARLLIHPEPRTAMRSRLPQLVFFHDFIIFESFPGQEPRKWGRYLHMLRKYRTASRVRWKLANSRFTRERALGFFPKMDPASITALHLGSRMRPASGSHAAPGPGEPVQCLYVGSFDSRKNIPALLANLGKVFPERNAVLHLVGRIRPQEADGLRMLADAARTDRLGIVIHGMLDDAALMERYASAHLLLFPSLFEGFGLPIIEAMSQGVVVAAFRNSCIPEVGGKAALLAADGDFEAWGGMIEAMFRDPSEYGRRSADSLRHAAEFSEDRVRERYRDHLLRVIGEASEAAPVPGTAGAAGGG